MVSVLYKGCVNSVRAVKLCGALLLFIALLSV